jgi:post-segregation antitoxin (ccd killing protein)
MADLTISVDEDTLRRARIKALERNETVNANLADALRRYAEESAQPAVFEELAALADKHRAGQDGERGTWRREDLQRG